MLSYKITIFSNVFILFFQYFVGAIRGSGKKRHLDLMTDLENFQVIKFACCKFLSTNFSTFLSFLKSFCSMHLPANAASLYQCLPVI